MTDSYIAVDLETTGTSPQQDHILEIGAVKVKEGRILETFETFVECPVEIPPFITGLTGITSGMVAGSPCLQEACASFLDFAGEEVLLGHNLLFDYSFLKQKICLCGGSFERLGLDTLHISRGCLPELPSRALDKLAAWYEIPQEHHHRALDDALTASRIYLKLMEQFRDRRPELFEPGPLKYKPKKTSPITISQKRYLQDLMKYHRIENDTPLDTLSKSEASRMIDGIILHYGRIKR